jgi:hypothetical protein
MAMNSEVQTGVKSAGCENSITHLPRNCDSFNGPWVVWASKSGASSPINGIAGRVSWSMTFPPSGVFGVNPDIGPYSDRCTRNYNRTGPPLEGISILRERRVKPTGPLAPANRLNPSPRQSPQIERPPAAMPTVASPGWPTARPRPDRCPACPETRWSPASAVRPGPG